MFYICFLPTLNHTKAFGLMLLNQHNQRFSQSSFCLYCKQVSN